MIRILSISDWYLPGFKAGGPIRSLSNLVAAMGESGFEFYVLTGDRDLGEAEPYPGIPAETWVKQGNASVLYMRDQSLWNFRRRIREIRPDVIYLNSFFSSFSRKPLLLRRLGLLPPAALLVAPRGELSPGALSIKWPRKKLYLQAAARAGMYRGVLWHSTAELEKSEIAKVVAHYRLHKGPRAEIQGSIQIAANIPEAPFKTGEEPSVEKRPGHARFVFVSRVSRKKNLAFALELLASLKGEVTYDIYGPADDPGDWTQHEASIARLPANIKVNYLGPIPHHEAQKKFSEYHFFLFPTLSENFGHVIAESLAAGCPVIISDQTPWSDLEIKNLGWDLPLDDRSRWLNVLQHCINMDGDTYRVMSQACRRFFRDWARVPEKCAKTVELFHWAVRQGGIRTELQQQLMQRQD